MVEVKTTVKIWEECKSSKDFDKRWIPESDYLALKKRLGELAEKLDDTDDDGRPISLWAVKNELLELSKT